MESYVEQCSLQVSAHALVLNEQASLRHHLHSCSPYFANTCRHWFQRLVHKNHFVFRHFMSYRNIIHYYISSRLFNQMYMYFVSIIIILI